MTLTDFLLARIAEDEAELGVLQTPDDSPGPNGIGWAEVGAISDVLMVSHRRALAECASKRLVVEYAGLIAEDPDVPPRARNLAWHAVIALATIYADHPDYREEWRAQA